MKRGACFILFILLISISFVFASFSVGDESHDVTSVYGPGEDLEGWINISLSNEPVTSLFEDTEDNVISLIDLLKSDVSLEQGIDYNCSAPDCGMTYSESDGVDSKIISLSSGESKIIGFKLTGDINDITSASFDINSNAGISCNNQLEIDFFDNTVIEHGNDKSGVGDCSHLKSYGCFDKDETAEELIMDVYCQRIKLSKSPGFKLGAWLKIENDSEITKIGIFDLNLAGVLAECELDNSPTPGSERYCEVDFLVTKSEDYYVCVYNDKGVIDPNTKIKGYADVEGCGFYVISGYPDVEDYAYQIFAEGKMFASVEGINITEIYPFEDGLSDEFMSYIYETYGGYDCSGECFIPIKFNSKAVQDITIENISILYSTTDGPKEEENIYELEQVPATIDSDGFIQVSLSNGNFTLPTQYGGFDYTLDLDNNKIFEESLYIERVPQIKYLLPVSGFNGIPTDFTVKVDLIDNASITSYVWQFEGATPKTTYTNKITHTFPNEGIFPVKVTVTDAKGKKASKTFYVEIKSYLLYFNQRINNVRSNLDSIDGQVINFSSFFQQGIKEILDTSVIRQQLTDLESRYASASTQQEYGSIINEFLALESIVPGRVFERISTGSLSYFPSIDGIEMGIVSEVLGGSYDITKSTAYKDAVLNWHAENISSKVKYNQIMADYEDGRSEPILNVFELDVKRLGGTGTIFIRELENLKFDNTYGEESKSGYIYIPLDSGKKIKFYTTQDIGIKNLPVFVSPAISELTIIEEFDEAEEKRIRWLLFFLIIFFLLIAGIIVYIVLQQWYKYKYENYLFKNRNYLFNLVNYIDTQKKKGIKESEIFRKLKKAGWNSEQINYVIRKYLGKRTGMLELPVEKMLGLFRKKPIQQPGIPASPGVIGPRPQRFRPRP